MVIRSKQQQYEVRLGIRRSIEESNSLAGVVQDPGKLKYGCTLSALAVALDGT